MEVTYRVDDKGRICWNRKVGDHWVRFWAENVRLQRGAEQAKISIVWDDIYLEKGELKVERREERNRLANAAQKAIPGEDSAKYSQRLMQHDFMLFCDGLMDFARSLDTPVWVAGAEAAPPKYLLRPYIAENAGTILFAPPGRGKSYTGLLWAFSVQYGLTNLWPTQQAPVLFVNLERSEASIAWRVASVARALGMDDRNTPLYMLNRRGQALADVIHAVTQTVDQMGIRLVVVDSLSRIGVGDLTENRPANQAMDMLNGLNCAWVALAHTPRSDETHAYGSVMFDAAADLMVELAAETAGPDLVGIGLKITKANDAPLTPREYLAYEFVQDGLVHIRPAEGHEFPELSTDTRERSTVDLVLEHLQTAGEDYQGNIALTIGRTEGSVSKAFTAHPHLFESERRKNRMYWRVREDL